MSSNTQNEVKHVTLVELQSQQSNIKELQVELENLNDKVKSNKPLNSADTKFINNLGWISTLSVSIAAIAASLQ